MADTAVEFEKRLVAFVDILGWAKAMESQPAASLYEALLPLRQHGEVHNEAFRQHAIAEYGDRVNPMMLDVQYAFFSDCFVFSMPAYMGGRIYSAVSWIVDKLLRSGFIARGGITCGPLFHRDQIVFGQALVAAYRIESQEAKFARVLVDESALQETGMQEHEALLRDHLGNWIVDPFPWYAQSADMRDLLQQFFDPPAVIQILERTVAGLSGQPRLRDIWRFQAEVCARSLEKYGAVANDWIAAFRTIATSDPSST